jgi:hypothetical protein
VIGTIIGIVGIVGFLYVLFISIEMEEESHARYLRDQEEQDRQAQEDHRIYPNLFADGVERRSSKPLPDIEINTRRDPSPMARLAYESRPSQSLITYDAPTAFLDYTESTKIHHADSYDSSSSSDCSSSYSSDCSSDSSSCGCDQ